MCLLAALPSSAAEKLFANGEKLIFPKSSRDSIMASAIVVTKNKHVIIFDGGFYVDSGHLVEIVKPYSETIDCWFLSHAHDDHCGAIIDLAKTNPDALKVRNVLYSFPPQKWLAETETWSKDETATICGGVAALPWRQTTLSKGDHFEIDGVIIDVLNFYDLEMTANSCNNSSLVFSVTMSGKRFIFTGDIGAEMSQRLVDEYGDGLKADIVTLSHHGQNGANKEFYARVKPEIAIWQTPSWLWDNDNGGGPGSGPWRTNYVKCWLQDIGVPRHFRNTFEDIVLE